ncbi:MAG: antibiotic biosynthesis monooxygenase [Chloroflexota bacterium]
MYLNYEVLPANRGRHFDVEERLVSGFVLARRLPGFVEAQVGKYLGSSTLYIAVRRWQDKASFEGWGKSAERQQYAAARPAGLYASEPKHWFLDEVLDSRGDGQGNFVVSTEFTLAAPAHWDEFLALRRDHDRVCVEFGGIVSLRHYRDTTDPAKVRFLTRCRSRSDYERLTAGPEIAAWRSRVPDGMFAIGDSQFFEVVREVSA